jgi:hypothetical protein
MKKFQWISDFLRHPKQYSGWESLSDIIPNDFDDYFLIHWNVGIVESYPFEEYPDQLDSIEEINLAIKIDKEHNLYLNPKENLLFKQTTLKNIALIFKEKLEYNLLNKIKKTPAIKTLDALSIDNLKKMVYELSKGEKLNLFVLEDSRNYRFSENNKEEPKQLMSDISVDEYFYWQEWFDFDYYTYLFPENKQWCITTSEDLPLFLCINKELTDRTISECNLELFRVEHNKNFVNKILNKL